MYTAVLMLAMTTGTQTTAWCHSGYGGWGGCHGCYGGYSCYAGYAGYGCYGCYGGCYGCYGGCYGCYGGCYGYGGYYRDRYYGYNFSGYPWSVGYSLTDGPMIVQGPSVVRDSYYSTPTPATAATVSVIVPIGDAQVSFNGYVTKMTGNERTFVSPPLSGAGKYMIQATWTEDGRSVKRERAVEVTPGQTVMVDFRAEAIPTNPKGADKAFGEKTPRPSTPDRD